MYSHNEKLFQPDIEAVRDFLERFKLQNYDMLHKCRNDGRRRAMLLAQSLPTSVVRDIQRRLKPVMFSDASYDDIESNLIASYDIKRSVIGAAVSFLTRKQKGGEALEAYAKVLNELASHCEYNDCCRDRLLRDTFVSGLSSSRIIRMLIVDCEGKSFNECVEKAKIIDQVSQDVKDINPTYVEDFTSQHKVIPYNSLEHHKPQQQPSRKVPSDYICFRCGTQGQHFVHKCFALKKSCNKCSKRGHISKVCRSRPSEQSSESHQITSEEDNSSHYVTIHELTDDNDIEKLSSNGYESTVSASNRYKCLAVDHVYENNCLFPDNNNSSDVTRTHSGSVISSVRLQSPNRSAKSVGNRSCDSDVCVNGFHINSVHVDVGSSKPICSSDQFKFASNDPFLE